MELDETQKEMDRFRAEIKELKENPLYLVDKDGTHEISEIKRELEELKKQTEWQPIETAPRDGSKFLALDIDGNIFTTRSIFGMDGNPKNGFVMQTPTLGKSSYPVKWQPLPQPPKKVKK